MNSKGFILITALLFLSLMMLLVLSQQQQVWLYHKSLNQLLNKHRAVQVMEKKIRQIIKKDAFTAWPGCLLPSDKANQVIERLLQGQGCPYEVNGLHYRFVIEALGTYPCMQSVAENRLHSTYHWRVTMASTDRDLLQIRFAQLIAEQPCTSPSPMFVKPGILSWRFLVV
ncbi:hypothetical protein GH742_05215 [Legionella sp. MW5194]|uniref:hypothetical protein n=1 Tax=Legionella sp. MW5194 TaxID=2662448 RepID=UPI00193E0096|nr:hypothetical protein [Legionella sp. MW5194]QRN03312.1 hypothetical protein GH742_05215 [Legionella sp. MW5194]